MPTREQISQAMNLMFKEGKKASIDAIQTLYEPYLGGKK